LKRFSASGRYGNRSKLDDFVDAPLTGLDMAPMITGSNTGNQIYDLFAVSNHFGGLGGGHCNDFVT
jgi:ubiquitin carboxyl-terminal hydrolase 4/11/15